MLLKINNLKFIINLKCLLLFSIALITVNTVSAQEIIEEAKEVKTDTISEQLIKKLDSVNTFKARKVDGVASVIGDFIVLESDIDKTFLQLEASGANVNDITRCELFGKLLEDKLYAHHAIQDSILVSDAEIRQNVDYQIQQFLQQVNGSMERLLRIYNKEDEKSFRDEMFEINKSNQLAQKMQASIVEELELASKAALVTGRDVK